MTEIKWYYALLILLISCNNKKERNSNEVDQNIIAIGEYTLDGIWELQKVNDTIFDIKLIYELEADQPRISFNFEDNNVSGFTGCNSFNGLANISENEIIILPNSVKATQQKCGNINNWEIDFFKRLSNIDGYLLKDSILNIIGNDEQTLTFKRKIIHPLAKYTWKLQMVNDTLFDMRKIYGPDAQPLINFDKNTVGGWDGCNNFSLEINFKDSYYTSGSLMSNARGCYDGWSEIFFGILGNNKSFVQSDSTLTLFNNEGESLKFIRQDLDPIELFTPIGKWTGNLNNQYEVEIVINEYEDNYLPTKVEINGELNNFRTIWEKEKFNSDDLENKQSIGILTLLSEVETIKLDLYFDGKDFYAYGKIQNSSNDIIKYLELKKVK